MRPDIYVYRGYIRIKFIHVFLNASLKHVIVTGGTRFTNKKYGQFMYLNLIANELIKAKKEK